MRKPLALLALVSLSWSQLATLHCEMRAPDARSHGGEHRMTDHAAETDDSGMADRAAGGHADHQHGPAPAECTLSLACGFSAIGPAIGGALPVPLGVRGERVSRPTLALAGRDPGAEPPPPRARS
jgi:hypothetical protein